MPSCVLIAIGDPAQRRLLDDKIRQFGYHTVLAATGAETLAMLEDGGDSKIALVLLDMALPDLDGIEVMDCLKRIPSHPPVIVQTAQDHIDAAGRAIRAGASDFIVSPASSERLDVAIKNALKISVLESEITRIRRQAEGMLTFASLVTVSPEMKRVMETGRRAAASDVPVLIEGEPGVGKEFVARAIHGESVRAGRPFVLANCAAMPEADAERLLFGGTARRSGGETAGKFTETGDGTLFLDEVGALPLDVQANLFRVLQTEPAKPANGGARVIAATTQDLIEEVKACRFREDLYYRLSVFPIWVPPLRQRLEDLPDLAGHFLARFAAEERKPLAGISAEALNLLNGYGWPGNVRQLENVMYRAVVLAEGDTLTVKEFPQIAAHVTGAAVAPPPAPAPRPEPVYQGPAMVGANIPAVHTIDMPAEHGHGALGIRALNDNGDVRPLNAVEADMIRLALGHYRGHMTEIARRLGIGRSTLYRKMRELGLDMHGG